MQSFAAVLLLSIPPVCAQQLSVRHYDVSDGLAHSYVGAIHQDAKGYLWFGTREGLSRFDGYRFTNYGTLEGLGNMIINAIVEDRQGQLWIGTNGGGVARLIDDPRAATSSRPAEPVPSQGQKFVSFRVGDSPDSNRVNALLFDAHNNLWCVTDDGIYRGAADLDRGLKFEVVVPHRPVASEMVAFADTHGRLWFGMQDELIEVVQDRIIKYGLADEVGRTWIESIIEDRQGRVLVANQRDVFEFIAPTETGGRGRWQRLPLTFKPDQGIFAMLVDSAGTLWLGTWNGLIKYQDGKQTIYTIAQGLSDNVIRALAEDRDGNLWIGTTGGGVCKLSGELIVSFTKTEGLPNQNVIRVIEDHQGRIYASIQQGGLVEIVAGKAVPISRSQMPPFDNIYAWIFQNRRGDWWVNSADGWFLFQGPELQLRRGKKLTAADGLPAESVKAGVSLYEDPAGKLWAISTDGHLYQSDTTRKGPAVFEHLPLKVKPPFSESGMLSDPSGVLWLGAQGGIARLIKGEIVALQPTAGLPETNPRAFFQDSRGWFWIGLRYQGVSVTRDPMAESLKFVNYSTRSGLASDTVWAITEDDLGRIYLGTGKGLDQLDPATGRIHHFNTKDGLAGDQINHCLKDRSGNIWVATSLGLSKFNPRAERAVNRPPPIYLSRVQVAGENLPLPETGAFRLSELSLPSSRNHLLIEYVALSFQGEQQLRYQYKLEGVDAEWNAPTEVQAVNYAHLAPGAYQFLVRAINQEGTASLESAAFSFRILPPLWQRWWFLTSAATLIGLVIYAIDRYRVGRLIELERVRTRIATDLHDDIGSSLSQIAILSEVARHQAGPDDSPVTRPLSLIARISRESVDSMSDIVWAINPNRDRLFHLTRRMRRFASEILPARNIEFSFSAPDSERDLKLDADLRRQVFLIFKESVNNIVRHSACTRVAIEFRVERAWLALSLSDNGQGFDPAQVNDGQGMLSMRRRAHSLGGEWAVNSSQGQGTVITLRVPHNRRKWTRGGRNHGP